MSFLPLQVLATDFEKHASILAEFTALTSDAMPYTITPSLSRSSARHSGPSGLSPTQEAAPMEELSIFSRSRHQATEDRPLFCSRRRWASSDLPTATLQEIEKERMLILKASGPCLTRRCPPAGSGLTYHERCHG